MTDRMTDWLTDWLNKQLKMEREFEELNDELKAIAIDTAYFGNEIVDLQQSSFVLGVRKELLLVIKGGVVRLSSPNNFITLMPNRWMKLITTGRWSTKKWKHSFTRLGRCLIVHTLAMNSTWLLTVPHVSWTQVDIWFCRTLHPACVYILHARVSLFVLMSGLISQHWYHLSTNAIRN